MSKYKLKRKKYKLISLQFNQTIDFHNLVDVGSYGLPANADFINAPEGFKSPGTIIIENAFDADNNKLVVQTVISKKADVFVEIFNTKDKTWSDWIASASADISNFVENYNKRTVVFTSTDKSMNFSMKWDASKNQWIATGTATGGGGGGATAVEINSPDKTITQVGESELIDNVLHVSLQAQGKQGERGPQGEIGKTGTDGKDGKDGAQGPEGKQGPSGKDGAAGKIQNIEITSADKSVTGKVTIKEDGTAILELTSRGGSGSYTAEYPVFIEDGAIKFKHDAQYFKVFLDDKDHANGTFTISDEFYQFLTTIDSNVDDALEKAKKAEETANAVDGKASTAITTANEAKTLASKAITKLTPKNNTTAIVKITDGATVSEKIIEVEATSGTADKATSLVVKLLDKSTKGALYGMTNKTPLPLKGMRIELSSKYPLYDFKNCTKIVSKPVIYDDYALNNYAAIDPVKGAFTFWSTKSVLGKDAVEYSPVSVFNMHSTDLDFTIYKDSDKLNYWFITYVNNDGFVEVMPVEQYEENGKYVLVGKSSFLSKFKSTQKDIKLLVHNTAKDGSKDDGSSNFLHIFYWTETGLMSTVFDMKNRKYLDKEYTVSKVSNGKGSIVLCDSPPYAVVTSKSLNKRLVKYFATSSGTAGATDKSTTATMEYQPVAINYDAMNDAFLMTYMLGIDGNDDLINQACVNLYRFINRNSILVKLCDLVPINFWALADTDDKKYFIVPPIQTNLDGSYIFVFRNPNSQCSITNFTVTKDAKIYHQVEDIGYQKGTSTGSLATPCAGAIGLTNGGGIELLLIYGDKSDLTYEQWSMPTINANNFIGIGADADGNIAIKGKFTFTGNQFITGKNYYIKYNKDNKYIFTTDSSSGIYLGLAVDANNLIY